MNTEDSEFARIEREQAMRNVPDPIHHTDTSEPLMYIQGWNDCRQAMLEQPAQVEVCCGDYGKCMKPCTPRGKWLAEQPAQQESVAWGIIASNTGQIRLVTLDASEVERHNPKHVVPLYATPQAQPAQPAPAAPVQEIEEYDAGLLAAAGGGDVEWWWDYIRAELGRAYEHYQSQMTAPQAQRTWVDPNNKTQKQYLPHIGEPVLFCHKDAIYMGMHTGGSFQSEATNQYFNTWECHWMYLPATHGIKESQS